MCGKLDVHEWSGESVPGEWNDDYLHDDEQHDDAGREHRLDIERVDHCSVHHDSVDDHAVDLDVDFFGRLDDGDAVDHAERYDERQEGAAGSGQEG